MKTTRGWIHRTALVGLVSLGLTGVSMADSGWGFRVGVSDEPDQVVGGLHWDLGPITGRWRWQPSVELGVGDDIKTVAGNLAAAYRFRTQQNFAPYLAAQLSAVYYDFDRGGNETEIGPVAVAGFDRMLNNDRLFRLELQVALHDDLPDAKIMAGWSFR